MKKFTVHLMTPYVTWEDVEAEDSDAAIAKCALEKCYDINEVSSWLFEEPEEDE